MSHPSRAIRCFLAVAVPALVVSSTPQDNGPDTSPVSDTYRGSIYSPSTSAVPAKTNPDTRRRAHDGGIAAGLGHVASGSVSCGIRGVTAGPSIRRRRREPGKGPLDVTGIRPSTLVRDLPVTQNILQADGRSRKIKADAVMRYEAVDGHDHFHHIEFQRYQLRPEGSTKRRGSRKEVRCPRDDGNLGGHPRRYDDEEFDCGEEGGKSCPRGRARSDRTMGRRLRLVPGEGQYAELDGFTLPGDFCVAAEADPRRLLTEASRDSPAAAALVHVAESAVSIIREGFQAEEAAARPSRCPIRNPPTCPSPARCRSFTIRPYDPIQVSKGRMLKTE